MKIFWFSYRLPVTCKHVDNFNFHSRLKLSRSHVNRVLKCNLLPLAFCSRSKQKVFGKRFLKISNSSSCSGTRRKKSETTIHKRWHFNFKHFVNLHGHNKILRRFSTRRNFSIEPKFLLFKFKRFLNSWAVYYTVKEIARTRILIIRSPG